MIINECAVPEDKLNEIATKMQEKISKCLEKQQEQDDIKIIISLNESVKTYKGE